MTSAQSTYRITFAQEPKSNAFDLSPATVPDSKRGARITWTDSGFGISGLSAAKIDSLILAILEDLAEASAREGPPTCDFDAEPVPLGRGTRTRDISSTTS
jgi:hypothetical protein